MNKKLTLGISIVSLAVSMTSFCYLTYAWFTFDRTATTSFLGIHSESGITYTLKYFTKNYNDDENAEVTMGYISPNKVANSSQIVTVDNYATDFLPIEEDPNLNSDDAVDVWAKYPGLRFSYAIEVEGVFSIDKDVAIVLENYVATASTTYYDTTTNAGITLARAVNIYAATILQDSSDVTTQANTFITSLSPTDKFTRETAAGPCEVALSSGLLKKRDTTTTKLIFIITLEFSDATSTFYKYSYTSGNIAYYNRDTTGDSNAYMNLPFTITQLNINLV